MRHQQTAETFEVTLSDETTAGLAELAREADREASALAADAIAEFVERERKIVGGIKQGLEDIAAGRVTPHEEVMRRIRAKIDLAEWPE